MIVFDSLFLLPVYVIAIMIDAAIFFLSVRLLTYVWQSGPLLFLDRIGAAGVNAVTDMLSRQVERWSEWRPSRRQEEALGLLLLCVTRLLLGVVLRAALGNGP
jgi:hypothetical protein